MDEFNLIEAQQSDMAFQSEMMSGVNVVENCDLAYSQQHDQQAQQHEQQEQQQQEKSQLLAEDAAFSEPQEKTIAEKAVDGDEISEANVVDNDELVSGNGNDHLPNIIETNPNAHTENVDDEFPMNSNEFENNANATVAATTAVSDETNIQNDTNNDEEEKKAKEEAEEVSKNENNGDGGEFVKNENERKNEDEIDTNQCRICMSTTNLLDIFRIGEKFSFRFCDLIMKLAPSIKINERDYLPHSICGGCVDRIEAAYELRIQCEETDKFLRSKLKRSKRTRRTPAEFVLIDCAESSSDSDDEQKSDDEFHLSEESEDESSESDSESSYDEKKKRIPRQRGKKRGPPPSRSNVVAYQSQPAKKPKNSGIVYIKAKKSEDDDEDDDTTISRTPGPKSMKRLQNVKPVTNRFLFRCDVCNRTCTSAEALAQHRRGHADEKCKICSLVFKQRSALLQHMQRHREDPERICQKCHRVFATKIECQRHFQTAHPGCTVSSTTTLTCNKCKRYFPNKQQFDMHKCINNDPRKLNEMNLKRKNDTETSVSGRDLFKTVAPLTTTYWSDSFSD